jgi:hypothetical protein
MSEEKICYRCGEVSAKLYCLSEHYVNVEVCYDCAMAYHNHKQDYVNDIYKRMKKRLDNV